MRLTRSNDTFHAHLVQECELRAALKNARTRAETILDGLFAQAVVLVESEGDREVYQAASESVKDYAAREVHFAHCGGTGGLLESARFYRKLKIPVAIITDLDSIADVNRVRETIDLLTPEWGELDTFTEQLRRIVNLAKHLPPSITTDEVTKDLEEMANLELDWGTDDDHVIRKRLSKLQNRIRRLRKLKEGGIESYSEHPEIQKSLRSAVEAAATVGLFFVPHGELEGWVSDLMSDLPVNGDLSKLERAIIAAERIRESSNPVGDIWEFVASVLKFLHIAKSW